MADNRFGISLLSKEKYGEAYLEEVMIDKLTGEVVIKTPQGDTISYNHNSRVNSHITATRLDANNTGIYGNIASIEFDGVACPFVAEFDKNYLLHPLDIPVNCKKLMVHVDIDPITRNLNGFSNVRNNILIETEICLKYTDGTTSNNAILSYSAHDLNNKIFHLQNNSIIQVDRTKQVEALRLQSFKIMNNIMDFSNNPISVTDVIRPICNSVLLVLET